MNILKDAEMDLGDKIIAANELRLGFFSPKVTNGIDRISQIRAQLAPAVSELSDEEAFVLMENLSWAYNFIKVNLEQRTKKKIKFEVSEREAKKLSEAFEERGKPRKAKKEKATSSASSTSKTAPGPLFHPDPAINSAIKSTIQACNGNINQAVSLMKAIGALPKEFQLES